MITYNDTPPDYLADEKQREVSGMGDNVVVDLSKGLQNHKKMLDRIGIGSIDQIHLALEKGNKTKALKLLKNAKINEMLKGSIRLIIHYY